MEFTCMNINGIDNEVYNLGAPHNYVIDILGVWLCNRYPDSLQM